MVSSCGHEGETDSQRKDWHPTAIFMRFHRAEIGEKCWPTPNRMHEGVFVK